MAQNILQKIVILSLVLLLCGCGPKQEEVQDIARDFINDRVKFYGVSSNVSEVTEEYQLSLINSVKDGGIWDLRYRVIANLSGALKETNVTVCIDRSGEVTHFNAKNAPCP